MPAGYPATAYPDHGHWRLQVPARTSAPLPQDHSLCPNPQLGRGIRNHYIVFQHIRIEVCNQIVLHRRIICIVQPQGFERIVGACLVAHDVDLIGAGVLFARILCCVFTKTEITFPGSPNLSGSLVTPLLTSTGHSNWLTGCIEHCDLNWLICRPGIVQCGGQRDGVGLIWQMHCSIHTGIEIFLRSNGKSMTEFFWLRSTNVFSVLSWLGVLRIHPG